MAKYKAKPEYEISVDSGENIVFDKRGYYETDDKNKIAILDGLVPKYVEKVDDGDKSENSKNQTEVKTATSRKKTSSKTSTSDK